MTKDNWINLKNLIDKVDERPKKLIKLLVNYINIKNGAKKLFFII